MGRIGKKALKSRAGKIKGNTVRKKISLLAALHSRLERRKMHRIQGEQERKKTEKDVVGYANHSPRLVLTNHRRQSAGRL